MTYDYPTLETPHPDVINEAENILRAAFYKVVYTRVKYEDRKIKGHVDIHPENDPLQGVDSNTSSDFWYAFQYALFECAISPDSIAVPVYEGEHPVFCSVLTYLYNGLEIDEKAKSDEWLEYWTSPSGKGFEDFSNEVEDMLRSMRHKDVAPLVDEIVANYPESLGGYYAAYDMNNPLKCVAKPESNYYSGELENYYAYHWNKYRKNDTDTPSRTSKDIIRNSV